MMRALHNVKATEKFVASGIYQYEINGRPAGISEQWSVHELPDEAHLIRVDYDAREHDGLTVLVEALTAQPPHWDHLERFDVQMIQSGDGVQHKVRLTVTPGERGVLVGTAIQGGEMRYQEVELPPAAIIRPPGHIFTGMMVEQAAGRGDSVPVFSLAMDIRASAPVISTLRSIQPTRSEDVMPEGMRLRCYAISGSNPALNGVFCLNEYGALVKGVWQDNSLPVVVLTQFAHR
ncbi:MAG: hypothetical protein K8I60_19900 [Anaerolineae bacterium]|nr:hypothetical protein [Anaerolineae bacterium]